MLPAVASCAGTSLWQFAHAVLPLQRCLTVQQSTLWSSQRHMSTAELQVQVEPLSTPNEGISVVSLARSGAKNAIGRQLLRELQEALNTLRQERTTRVVVLRSSCPGTFCAGADLKERATMTQAETAEFVGSLRRSFSDLAGLPMPTIAVLEGYAFGGGAELALACDLRVADTRAELAFPEARLGIMPGAGGTQRLPRLVGLSKAKELIYTARRVCGTEAVRLGLADHCVEEGKAMERALELAREIAQSAPLSLRSAKAAINQGVEVDLATGLKLEEYLYAQLIPTRDRLEGLKAFAEKRKPNYMGE
ncbi:ClpP/crotonase-like domain-containing protein [Scenedesmus sp. NREL 46B-D3]|nr:ClpP/crotonase-like domain-containing protein [Scenedesmus sp. NREL 46B-D3]